MNNRKMLRRARKAKEIRIKLDRLRSEAADAYDNACAAYEEAKLIESAAWGSFQDHPCWRKNTDWSK